MLGVMFFLAQKHIPALINTRWAQLCTEAGLIQKTYSPTNVYEDLEWVDLFEAASRSSCRPLAVILEEFGEAIVPDLIRLYEQLIDRRWTALDLLLNTERLIHAAVRRNSPGAAPPVIQCQQTTDSEVQIIYSSRRQLCSLARGIIRGTARHFNQDAEVTDDACTLQGDPFCSWRVVIHPTQLSKSAQTTEIIDLGAMNATPIPPSPTLFGNESTLPPDVVTNKRIAHYQLVRFLGRGGMASVFVADDLLLGRQVAIKVASREMTMHPTFRQRLLREAQAMAAVQSDHVVSIYQVGQHGECPYIAMQLLTGISLEQWRKQRCSRISFREVVRIGREIALGLSAIHCRGLVHRDIKPTNIWLEAPNRRVKLLDFGLVRDTSCSEALTQQGTILGTPEYMAPEQAAGLGVDARCDLYSLGVVLYELVTDRLPFVTDNVMNLLTMLALETPRPTQEFNPRVPPNLNALIMQLLEKDAGARPCTANLVATSLEKMQSGCETFDDHDFSYAGPLFQEGWGDERARLSDLPRSFKKDQVQ